MVLLSKRPDLVCSSPPFNFLDVGFFENRRKLCEKNYESFENPCYCRIYIKINKYRRCIRKDGSSAGIPTIYDLIMTKSFVVAKGTWIN